MKVYVLMCYVDYEESGLLAVYSSIEQAELNTGIRWSIVPKMVMKTSSGSYQLHEMIIDNNHINLFDIE
jgi:hypothetical protein